MASLPFPQSLLVGVCLLMEWSNTLKAIASLSEVLIVMETVARG